MLGALLLCSITQTPGGFSHSTLHRSCPWRGSFLLVIWAIIFLFLFCLVETTILLSHLLSVLSYWDPEKNMPALSVPLTHHLLSVPLTRSLSAALAPLYCSMFHSPHPSQFRTCTSWLCLYLGFLLHILSQICLFQITWIICIAGFELMLDAEGQTVCNQFSEKLWKAYLRIFLST